MEEQKMCRMIDARADIGTEGQEQIERMTALSREQILAADDTTITPLPVPEWGGLIYIRTITAGEWDAFENSLVSVDEKGNKKTNLDDYRARFAVIVCADQDGSRLFTAEDVKALSRKSRAPLDRILEAGKAINKISEEDEEALVQNLDKTPSEDS